MSTSLNGIFELVYFINCFTYWESYPQQLSKNEEKIDIYLQDKGSSILHWNDLVLVLHSHIVKYISHVLVYNLCDDWEGVDHINCIIFFFFH